MAYSFITGIPTAGKSSVAEKIAKEHGIVFLGESFETTLKRNKENPRWGKTEELQKKEAEDFFFCSAEAYKKDGERYGWKIFNGPREAERELLKIIGL